jgi:protein-S-isoprenylcysteine O-methyltransferase Ste14
MYSGHLSSIVTILCWAGWWGYWAVTWGEAKGGKKYQTQRQLRTYVFMLMTGFIFLLSDSETVVRSWYVLRSPGAADIGAALTALGFILTIWSRRVLKDNWSADVEFKKGQGLVTSGPYALSRHPIYTGLSLMFIGTALVQGTIFSFAAIVLGITSFWIKLKLEEAMMLKHFGEQYSAYQRRVKRLIPYLL